METKLDSQAVKVLCARSPKMGRGPPPWGTNADGILFSLVVDIISEVWL